MGHPERCTAKGCYGCSQFADVHGGGWRCVHCKEFYPPMTMNPDSLEVWNEACAAANEVVRTVRDQAQAIEQSNQAAAAIIAQHYEPLVAEVERLRGELHRLTIELQQHKDALAQVGEKS